MSTELKTSIEALADAAEDFLFEMLQMHDYIVVSPTGQERAMQDDYVFGEVKTKMEEALNNLRPNMELNQ